MIEDGSPNSLGARCLEGGVNFALFSDVAEAVATQLFSGLPCVRTTGAERRSQKSRPSWKVSAMTIQELGVIGKVGLGLQHGKMSCCELEL